MFSLGGGCESVVRRVNNCENAGRSTDDVGINCLEFWNWRWNSFSKDQVALLAVCL